MSGMSFLASKSILEETNGTNDDACHPGWNSIPWAILHKIFTTVTVFTTSLFSIKGGLKIPQFPWIITFAATSRTAATLQY